MQKLENIALGKPYTMSEQPSYPLCTDPGDATDLTDGVVWDEDALWGRKSTVGWGGRKPVHITIDLGAVEAIMGAALHTGAGEASVVWLSSIAVQVSEDGENFYLAGDLVRLDENPPPPAYRGYASHTYRTTKLETRGRYVRFELISAAEFIFADEIEVYRGDEKLLALPNRSTPVDRAQLTDKTRLTRLGVHRRIRADLEETRARVLDSAPPDEAQLLNELQQIQTELEHSDFPVEAESFKAIVPFNALHRRVFQVYSHLLPPADAAGIHLWHTPPYAMLPLFATPGEPLRELRLALMQNERRAEVFNITNSSREALQLRLKIENLPGSTNPDYIKVHQVEYVDTREGEVVATALVPLELEKGHYLSHVAAGMTRQIWLAVDRPEIAAGAYEGKLKISCGQSEKQLSFALSIAPLRFPDQADCSLEMWDYLADINIPRYGTTAKNRPAAIRDMIDHRVDAVWGEWGSLPQIKPRSGVGKTIWDFDAAGNLVAELDFSGWDRFVKMWPQARYYLLAHPFGTQDTFAGHAQGSDSFNRALAQWASRWAEHNRSLGLPPRRAGICFFDEPSDEATFKTTYLFARAFKQGTDEILVWSDPSIEHMQAPYMREALEQCDILCPNLRRYLEGGKEMHAFYRHLQARGKQFWFYTCNGPTRMFNPAYYRLQPWHCFQHGATGAGFWAYADAGGTDSWNEYPAVGRASFSPLYFSPDSIATSKHWEAALEGIQDYQYLKMLQDHLDHLEKTSNDASSFRLNIPPVHALATSLIKQVSEIFGTHYAARLADDPSALAEEGRLNVLEMLRAFHQAQ